MRYQESRFEVESISRKEGPLILRGRSCYLIASMILLIATLMFTACSKTETLNGPVAIKKDAPAGPSTSKPAGNSDDFACKLVTKAEAEAVMGEKLKDPDSGPASMQGGSICTYESPDSMSARHVSVRVEAPNFNWDKFKEDKREEGEKMQPQKRPH